MCLARSKAHMLFWFCRNFCVMKFLDSRGHQLACLCVAHRVPLQDAGIGLCVSSRASHFTRCGVAACFPAPGHEWPSVSDGSALLGNFSCILFWLVRPLRFRLRRSDREILGKQRGKPSSFLFKAMLGAGIFSTLPRADSFWFFVILFPCTRTFS